jgi:uncharacterized protein (TIGR02271 family)
MFGWRVLPEMTTVTPVANTRGGTMNALSIREGMTVWSSDGEKLGKVVALGDTQLQIEKGIFFPKDYLADRSAIQEVRDNDVILNLRKDDLRNLDSGAMEATGAPATDRDLETSTGESRDISLVEEQLEVEKKQREAGKVQLKKEVVTETQQVTVPVQRERVRIEHAPAGREASPSEAAFKEESASVTLHEEEVEIKKRPVVREQVRLRKETETENRQVADSVRKEEARVIKEGDVDGPTRH